MEKKSDPRRNRFSFIIRVAVITESVKEKYAFSLKIYTKVNKFQHVRSFPWHGKQLALTILNLGRGAFKCAQYNCGFLALPFLHDHIFFFRSWANIQYCVISWSDHHVLMSSVYFTEARNTAVASQLSMVPGEFCPCAIP